MAVSGMSNCPNCGAALPAPDHKGTLRCSYCGSLIEVGAIEFCPNVNIPEHELLKQIEELKKLKVSVTEPVYIDFHLDNEQLNKYFIGGINDKKRTI